MYRGLAHQCTHWLPHELLHCFDNINRTVTTNENYQLWQTEHIPSTMQLNLLAAAAKRGIGMKIL